VNGAKRFSIAMVAACPFPANYGSPAAIRELCEALGERGHAIHIVTYPHGHDLPVGKVQLWRVADWRTSRAVLAGPSLGKLWLDFLLLVKLCGVIRRQRIEIIHAHNYEGVLIGIAAKLITRCPLVYNAVNLMSDELPSYGFIRPVFMARLLARWLDWFVPLFPERMIAVTTELYNHLLAGGVAPGRLARVPLGIKTARFDNANQERFRKQYSLGTRPVVMYTGINNRFQRIDYLLRAFQLVVREEPSAVLMAVSPLTGEPDLATSQALARTLEIEDRVIWVESQELEDLADYLAAATVTVIPRPEVPGHPIKLLNYMAAAKPIVCFAGAAKEVRAMREALVVPDHDWWQLGKAVVQLLRDPELAGRLAANARTRVVDTLDWPLLCDKIELVYETLTVRTHALGKEAA
jgi:1,2-diacylglycerol 3-alpha-glucosyltransferase